jgi:hypothetical protein
MKLFRVTCCCFVLFLSLVVFAQVPWSQASAASARVTKGNVEALLHARIGAGGIYFPSAYSRDLFGN